MGVWRRLTPGDAEGLRVFLLRHEDYAAGFTGRILREGELRIPGVVSGGVFGVLESDGLRGAVLWTSSGTAFPIFERPFSPEQGVRLSRFFQGGNLSSVLGASAHVQTLEDVLGATPRLRVAYRSFYRSPDSPIPEPFPRPAPGALALQMRPEDATELFPLHSAYEREEVVTELHRFDPAASRASLARSLETEIVVAATMNGRPVATARTNARGLRTWQIGGVYVVPELRGRGWGRYVVGYLLEIVIREGKGAGLFVKEQNARARGLYRSMGFRDVGAYRVDYL